MYQRLLKIIAFESWCYFLSVEISNFWHFYLSSGVNFSSLPILILPMKGTEKILTVRSRGSNRCVKSWNLIFFASENFPRIKAITFFVCIKHLTLTFFSYCPLKVTKFQGLFSFLFYFQKKWRTSLSINFSIDGLKSWRTVYFFLKIGKICLYLLSWVLTTFKSSWNSIWWDFLIQINLKI